MASHVRSLKKAGGGVSPAFFGLSIDINVVPWPPHTFSSTISLTMDTNDTSATKGTRSESSSTVRSLTLKQSKLGGSLRQVDSSLYAVDVEATSADLCLVRGLTLDPGQCKHILEYKISYLAHILTYLSKVVNAPRQLQQGLISNFWKCLKGPPPKARQTQLIILMTYCAITYIDMAH